MQEEEIERQKEYIKESNLYNKLKNIFEINHEQKLYNIDEYLEFEIKEIKNKIVKNEITEYYTDGTNINNDYKIKNNSSKNFILTTQGLNDNQEDKEKIGIKKQKS